MKTKKQFLATALRAVNALKNLHEDGYSTPESRSAMQGYIGTEVIEMIEKIELVINTVKNNK